MRRATFVSQFFLGVALLLLSAAAAFAQDPELLRHFDYDSKTPLNIKQIGVQGRARANVYDITYDSLAEQLKLRRLPAAAIAGIPNPYQPPD